MHIRWCVHTHLSMCTSGCYVCDYLWVCCVHVSNCKHLCGDVFVHVSLLECLQERMPKFPFSFLYTRTQYPLVDIKRKDPKDPLPTRKQYLNHLQFQTGPWLHTGQFLGWPLRGPERANTHLTGYSV